MKKKLKFIILPLICILVVGITFFLLFDLRNKVEEKNYNVDDIEVVENDYIATTENEVEEENEVIENTSKENTNDIQNNTIENKVNNQENSQTATSIYEDNTDAGSTNKKEEAINLVKQKWGEDDTVLFRCDSVLNNGEYVVAVISKSTASVKNYFRVNLEKKTVEVDY